MRTQRHENDTTTSGASGASVGVDEGQTTHIRYSITAWVTGVPKSQKSPLKKVSVYPKTTCTRKTIEIKTEFQKAKVPKEEYCGIDFGYGELVGAHIRCAL